MSIHRVQLDLSTACTCPFSSHTRQPANAVYVGRAHLVMTSSNQVCEQGKDIFTCLVQVASLHFFMYFALSKPNYDYKLFTSSKISY